MASVDSDSTLFYICIQGMFKSWTALQLAVTHSFAGPHSREKAQWLVGVVETFFLENKDLEPYEVEEFLEQIISNEFNIVAEDDSIKQISKELCKLYQLWSKGNHIEMKAHIAKLPCINLGDSLSMDKDNPVIETEQCPNLENLNCTSSDKESKNVISHIDVKALRTPDDDGWMPVIHKKKH